jgi:hypothetical protein
VFICLTLFCRGALLSWRSFVAALFCRCALLSLRCATLIQRVFDHTKQGLEASALAHCDVTISGLAFSIFDLTFHLKLEISFLDFSECLTVVVYHCVIQITIMALKCRFLVSLKIKMIVKSGLKPYLAQTLNQKRVAK